MAKFKKALGGKKPGLKLLPLPSNVDRTMWYDPGAVNFKVCALHQLLVRWDL